MDRRLVGWVWRTAALALLTTAVLWGARADATVMVEVALEDMARDSVAIVHGRVVRTGSHVALREGGGMDPYTVTTLKALEWIKGPGGDEIVLREIGGMLPDGGGMAIDGVPDYPIGEEVVVFLETDPEAGSFYRTYAMVQGKFTVMHGVPGVPDTVVRDAEAVSFARWSRGRMTLHRGEAEAMTLESFLDVVAGAVRLSPPRIEGPTGGVTR